MTGSTALPTIKLFQFPRRLGVPNLSPFCCKLETWLRIAGIRYEVVVEHDPRKGPKRKLPFIEDAGVRIADSSLIVEHLQRTRGLDLDAHLSASQRAISLLVQRTLEEHYAFVMAYTHLIRDEGLQHTRARFDVIPSMVRPFVARAVTKHIQKALWLQGLLRHSHEDIMDAAIRDWRAVLAVMGDDQFFFGDEPTGVDAIVFGTLAPTVLVPIESPIRDFLRSQAKCLDYTNRMLERFFPEFRATPAKDAVQSDSKPRATQVRTRVRSEDPTTAAEGTSVR
jgi:glutathione S-transferase